MPGIQPPSLCPATEAWIPGPPDAGHVLNDVPRLVPRQAGAGMEARACLRKGLHYHVIHYQDQRQMEGVSLAWAWVAPGAERKANRLISDPHELVTASISQNPLC